MPVALTDPITLLRGIGVGAQSSGSGSAQDVLTRVAKGVAAAGTAASQLFVTPAEYDGVLTFIPQLGGATVLTADLEVSNDGGTTWVKHTVGMTLATAPARVQIGPNVLCRLNFTTVTGGTANTHVHAVAGPVA